MDLKRWRPDLRSLAITAVVALPVLVAIVRALAEHRAPLGDDGLIALRANDVLTGNHPWFGTWTSASLSTGVDFNNPSPLHFELLALLVKPFGLAAGAVLGAGCLNIAAIAVAIRQGRHFDGRRGEAIMAVAASGLVWTLGSEMLVDVWQPHSLVLPFLAFMASCIAVAGGRWRSLGWAVFIGSMVMGAHLSFTYVVLGLLAASVVCAWRIGHDGWRRGVVLGLVVGVLSWLQPILEQFFGVGRGNLSRVLQANSSSDKPLGLHLATRLVTQVVIVPPWWFRPSFTDSVASTPYSADGALRPKGLIGGVPAAMLLAVLFVGLAALILLLWRRRLIRPLVLLVMASVGLLAALGTATVMPAGIIGLAPHQMRWLWPIAALLMLAVANALDVLFVAGRLKANVRTAAAGAAVLLLAIVALPAHNSDLGPSASRNENGAVRSLMAQLEHVHLPGPTVFDGSTLQFAEPYSGAVLAALTDAGQPIRAGDPSFARQLGEARRPRNDELFSLQVRNGPRADTLQPGEDYLAKATTAEGTTVAVVLIDRSVSGD